MFKILGGGGMINKEQTGSDYRKSKITAEDV